MYIFMYIYISCICIYIYNLRHEDDLTPNQNIYCKILEQFGTENYT